MSAICPKCQCGCLIVSYDCLYDADSRIKEIDIEKYPQYLNYTNSFMLIGTEEDNGILGQECFSKLCEAIKTAQTAADTYNKNTPETMTEEADHNRTYIAYLVEPWLTLTQNMHFINAYAANVMYYYYRSGRAASMTTKDGDVTSNKGKTNNNTSSTNNITYDDCQKMAGIQKSFAIRMISILKREVIDKSPELYCQEVEKKCTCGKNTCSDCTGLRVEPNRKTRIKTVAL